MQRCDRRQFLELLGSCGASALVACTGPHARDFVQPSAAPAPELAAVERGNFRAIYADPAARERFFAFLTNVFHLYPEADLQQLIADAARESDDDARVYQRIAARLPEIAPLLGAFRYALPALRKQQQVMAGQTLQLLRDKRRFEGYLEIGSDGRYLGALKEQLEVEGPIYTSSSTVPGFGPDEIIDRRQLAPVGTHLPMNDYAPLRLPAQSLELVTIYVGLHHVPLARREAYVTSIRDAMKPRATLILRDHDVTSAQQRHLVALAHDVFNVGTGQPWSANAQELRNFYPLDFVIGFLAQHGFEVQQERLRQAGDPTLNTLLSFTKA